MPRGEQLGRQWQILQVLMASRRGATAAALAESLGCHLRTVYRDLDALQAAGFPIYNYREEGQNHWALIETAKQPMPIPMNLTELMALYLSRHLLAGQANSSLRGAMASVLKKIKATLPPDYCKYLAAMEASVAVGPVPCNRTAGDPETVDALSRAAANHRYVEITYFSMHRRNQTQRRIAPYKIWFFNNRFYVIADCRLRQDIRIFAVDRIKKLSITSETFHIPPDFDAEAFMASGFGVFPGDPVPVRIWFSPSSAGYVMEKIWHPSQSIEQQENGAVILEMTVAPSREIKAWLLAWGADAVVLTPISLRNAILEEARKIEAIYHVPN